MKNKRIKLLSALAASIAMWAASSSVRADDCCIQISAPSNTATVNITSPFLVTGDTNAADNVATFIEQVIVGNPSVAPGSYPGWCVDIVDDISKGPQVYNTVMHSSCDSNLNSELQAGYPANVYVSPETWHLINYILNHKGSNYFWNIQEALWYFIGGPPLVLGPPYPPTDLNAVQAIIDDAQANGPAWQMQCGDIEAVVVEIVGTPLQQLTIIEVPTTPTCNISFIKIPPANTDLGCNPTVTIPDCTGTVDTNVINATATSGTVTITCSKVDSIVNCKNVRVITYVATSSTGCSATNVSTVTWTIDKTIPNLTVPKGTNLGCNPGTLPQDSDIQAQSKASDTCSTPTISVTHADSSGPCGYTRVFTVTATDACQNVATGYVTVTWTVDTTAPTITSVPAGTNYGCTTVTLPTDAGIKALVKATDTCSTPTISVSHADVTSNCVTTRTFTITAKDDCGNISAAKTVVYSVGCACASIGSGDTATIGFWHNKNGQALICAQTPNTALATWLATTFPYLYGANAPAANNLTGKKNSDVAALFLTFFGVTGQKTDAQIMAGALADYVTTASLGGTTGSKYGFNSSPGGTGGKTYNVGSNGTAIGLSNNTSYTVAQLLQQVNFLKQHGLYTSAAANAFNVIFSDINQTGDIN